MSREILPSIVFHPHTSAQGCRAKVFIDHSFPACPHFFYQECKLLLPCRSWKSATNSSLRLSCLISILLFRVFLGCSIPPERRLWNACMYKYRQLLRWDSLRMQDSIHLPRYCWFFCCQIQRSGMFTICTKHYPIIMPWLFNALKNLDGAEYKKLRARAMECAGCVGQSFYLLSVYSLIHL